mmetsp:Transcript_12388/g.20239  ORF Transcript_12388/g.20239 Transcript_12388/m.20239 type:complete len:227 (-) Transcript_12388:36-716(-)
MCPGAATEEGYLAPIQLGEHLEILHVEEEEGWVYARRRDNPHEAGWVLAQVVDPAPIASTSTSDVEKHEDEMDTVDQCTAPSIRFAAGDEVFHLRPGGACTVLRKHPSAEADAIDRGEALGHNAPARVIAVQGDWVLIRTKAGAAVDGAEGWLMSAHLSLAEVPLAEVPLVEVPVVPTALEAPRPSAPTSALRRSSSKGSVDAGIGSLPTKRKVTFVLPDSPAAVS